MPTAEHEAAKRQVGDVRHTGERIERLEEAELAAVDVAQAGHGALIEEGVADGDAGQPGVAEARDGFVDVEVVGEQVRPEPRQARMDRQRSRLDELDGGGVEADADRARHFDDGDRPGDGAPPALAGPISVPRAVETEVGVKRQAAVEGNEEVLTAGLDMLHVTTDDEIQAGTARPAPRGDDRAPDERVVQHRRDAGERVTFRHRPALDAAASRGTPAGSRPRPGRRVPATG